MIETFSIHPVSCGVWLVVGGGSGSLVGKRSVKKVWMALVTPAFLKKVDRVFLDLGDNLMHLLDLSTEDDDDDVPMVEGIL